MLLADTRSFRPTTTPKLPVGARRSAVAVAAVFVGLVASSLQAQVIVYPASAPATAFYAPMAPMAPMAAGYPGGFMANYSPAGNYAAVTAFSPPVAPSYVANYAAETVASPVNVTSYYAPATSYATPVTSYYSPTPYAPVGVTAYSPVMAAPVYATPVTTYYAPNVVAVPLYRRGLFGGLRPVRSAMYIPY